MSTILAPRTFRPLYIREHWEDGRREHEQGNQVAHPREVFDGARGGGRSRGGCRCRDFDSAASAGSRAGPGAGADSNPSGTDLGIGFTIADDPSSSQVVLFGGVDNYDNTWTWSGGHWALARPATSSPGRIDAAGAYDPQTKQVLLFGGRHAPFNGGPSLNDTWAWNGATWRELDGGTGGATSGEGASMAWDDALGEMVLVTDAGSAPGGDQTWVSVIRTRWQPEIHGAFAPSAFDLPMAFDPITQSLIAEGCCYVPQSPLGALDTTWRWDGQRWLQIAGTAAPLPGFRARAGSIHRACDALQLRLGAGPAGPGVMDRMDIGSGECRPASGRAGHGDQRREQRPAADPLGQRRQGNQFVAQPVHVWALSGSKWARLNSTTAGG